jgi:hypothetical protein
MTSYLMNAWGKSIVMYANQGNTPFVKMTLTQLKRDLRSKCQSREQANEQLLDLEMATNVSLGFISEAEWTER